MKLNVLIFNIIMGLGVLFFYSCNEQVINENKIKSEVVKSKPYFDTSITFLIYGPQPKITWQRANANDVIAKKWGIKFKFIDVGDVVQSEHKIDSAEVHNNKIRERLKKKFGDNWSEKFEKAKEREFELEKIAMNIIDKQGFVIRKKTEIEKEDVLRYYLQPIDSSSTFNVSAYGFGRAKDTIPNRLTYFKLIVDYKKETVKLISDKIEKE